jgi:hypothetical protein
MGKLTTNYKKGKRDLSKICAAVVPSVNGKWE